MNEEVKQESAWSGWAILELMGHRKLVGVVSECVIGSQAFIRIDVPSPLADAPPVAAQFYSPSAVYCLTPTTEEVARQVAGQHLPAPVQRWELPAAETDSGGPGLYGDDFR